MADNRGGSERKNYIIKTLLIVILLLLALLSTVFYVYAYPKSTITLYSICGGNQVKEETFQIKKYSPIGSLKPIEKLGYEFQYWAYDDRGTRVFDGEKEVDVDYLDLFGMYEVKEFDVTLHIQEYDGETKLEKYTVGRVYKDIKFNTYLELWDGMVINSATGERELDSRLSARTGYDFVGWTTKVQEEDVMSESDVIRVGDNGEGGKYSGKFWVLQDSDIDLYAYWEKRSFDIVSYTGNEYQMNGSTPARDENGKFIIRNNALDHQGLGIKYLNSLASVTSIANATLIAENGWVDANGYNDNDEYEFKGWFLDYDYTLPATDDLIVKISEIDGKTPYLISSTVINPTFSGAVVVGSYNEDTRKYEFALYSKWERKSYTLSFKKNLSGAGGINTQIASISVYKYDERYGKYYQTLNADQFTRDNANINYFCSIDLSCESVTSANFLNAFSSYRFMGWSEDVKAEQGKSAIYYQWTQNDIHKVSGYEAPRYTNLIYTHRVSEDVTLYAQWSTIRTVTFYQKSSTSNSTSSFTIKGVAGEWFVLPTTAQVVGELGWSNKSYNFFAGWKPSTYSNASNSIIYEYQKGKDADDDGKDDTTGAVLDQNLYILDGGKKVLNQDYIHIIGSNNLNYNYYAYWENKVYTVEFYRNDGTDATEAIKTVKGGNNISFPTSPVRENYIFDGWSTTKYEDNILGKNVVNSVVMATGDEQVIKYYASWTMNFTVSYDANGGRVSRTMPTIQYSTKGKNLTLEVQTLNASSYISKEGNTFDGWLLRKEDGSFVDLVIGQRETYIFDFQTYQCHKKQQTNTQYDFVLGDGMGNRTNEVVLYAKWKANEYKITIVDGITSTKTSFTAKHGDDGYIDLSQYITEHLGYKFTHLSTSRGGTDVAITPTASGEVLLPQQSILSNLTFYAIYELRIINLSYKISRYDGSEVAYEPTSPTYSHGAVKYGDTLILPTPNGIRDYGNGNFLFRYWYYMDGSEKIIVENNTKLKYDGDELALWAEFEEQRIYIQFKFVNPLDDSDVVNISTVDLGDGEQEISIQKGEKIDETLYDAVMSQVEALITERDIREYTFEGLYYYYFGSPYTFTVGADIPSQDTTGILQYTTKFSANDVLFVYDFKGTQSATAHGGNKFDSKSDIILASVSELNFTTATGEDIISWYLLENNDPDNEKYPLQLGDYLIKTVGSGDYFKSIADMSKYIVWKYDEIKGRYVGTITIHAETEKNINVTYYAIASDGQLKQVSKTNITYDAFGNSMSLLTGSSALVGFDSTSGLQFNGWRVYKGSALVTTLGNNGLVEGVLNIDVDNIFTDYDVKLYADISYIVSYEKVVQMNGSFAITSLKVDTYPLATSDFDKVDSYHLTHTLETTPVSVDEVDGYEYYGYKIGNKVYSKSDIATGISLEITGAPIEILCYIARTIEITYTLGSVIEDEKFADGTTEDKVEQFVLDFENNVIAIRGEDGDIPQDNITITTAQCEKVGYSFVGWSMINDGQISNEVLKSGDVIHQYDDVTLVAIFKEPESASLTAKFVYKYTDINGDLHTLREVSIANANGTIQSLLQPSQVTEYVDAYSGITGWMYQGQVLTDGVFLVPLLIKNNQEFIFVAIIKAKYTLEFETFSEETVPSLVVYDGQEYRLSARPTLDNGNKIKAWAYSLDEESEPIEIRYNDAIIFRASTENNQVVYSCTKGIEYDLHIIPVQNNIYTYKFYAIGEDISLTLYASTNDSETPYLLEHVTFGHTYGVRDLVTIAGFDSRESDSLGIVAWTQDSSRTQWSNYTDEEKLALENNITNISSNRTLYAVWQSKYQVTYATANDTFGYRDSSNLSQIEEITPESKYYFAGDKVFMDASVIKSIYHKGYNTVYYDNGTYIVYLASSNDYYQVTGFTYTYSSTSYSKGIDESFDMPEANVVITPIFSQVHKVNFYKNTTNATPPQADELLYSAFAVDLSTIDLSRYTTTRESFEFKGWSTSRDGEKITSLENGSQDVDLYAVWESKISIVFTVNGEATIFRVPLNREGKINKTQLSSYLDMNNNPANGNFNHVSLNDNDRTYNYNNINYYLSYFAYNNRTYNTIDDICDVVFSRATTVNMILDTIYTIKYAILDDYGENIVIENKVDYFVKSSGIYGAITSDSCSADLTFATYDDESLSDFYEATGWKDSSQKFYAFNSTVTAEEFNYLTELATNREIILTLNLEAKSISIKLYSVENPYAVYSQFQDDGSDAQSYDSWVDVAETYVKDYSGNAIEGENISLPYGSSFTLTYPTSATNNYQIIGWSSSILPLGATSTASSDIRIYYCYDFRLGNGVFSSEALTLDNTILNADGSLVLYPVYKLATMHDASIYATDGEFNYSLANDETKCVGYVNYLENAREGKTNALDCEFAFYQTLTIKADSPKTNYTLKAFKYNNADVTGTQLVLRDGAVSQHRVVIEYEPRTVEITLNLEYTQELTDGDDASTITVNGKTLSHSHTQDTISLLANALVTVSTDLSEYYVLETITAGEDNIVLIDNSIDISRLTIDENGKITILFTLSPKTYNVSLNLQGGDVTTFTYSSSAFGSGDVVREGNLAKVIAGAEITMSDPVKEGNKYAFMYYLIDGTRYDHISGYVVNSDISIVAFFMQNMYTITYKFNGGKSITHDFVGGSNILVGQIEGTDMSQYVMDGIEHLGWKLEGEDTLYVDGTTFATSKKNYTFYEATKGKTVNITFQVLGENKVLTPTMNVEYGTEFTLPTENYFTSDRITGKALYGFTDSDSGEIIKAGSRITLSTSEGSQTNMHFEYAENITIYAVYYSEYTYTFKYETNYGTGESAITSSTTIADGIKTVTATSSSGNVLLADLMYTISSVIPVSNVPEMVFAGYTLSIDGVTQYEGEQLVIVNAGDKITLANPSNYNYRQNYIYTLSATYESTVSLKALDIVITNPADTTTTLKLTVDGEEKGSYMLRANDSAKLYMTSLPLPDYESESGDIYWKIGDNIVFSTTGRSIIAYKVIGYKCEYIDATGNVISNLTKNITLDSEEGISIADGNSCRLSTIWEVRYKVTYYDTLGVETSSQYYDKDTILVVDSEDKYSKDGYKFVGYANTLNKDIESIDDFYALGVEYSATQDYSFYPAFSKIYTAVYHDNQSLLEDSYGDWSKANNIVNKTLNAYIGMPSVQLLDYYAWYYNDIGYSFAGLTVTADTLANDLEDGLLDTTYTLDISHISNDELHIYVAWMVEEEDITFVISAISNNASLSYFDTTALTLTFRYNDIITLDYFELIEEFEKLDINEDTNYIIDNFEFRCFSTTQDGRREIETYPVRSDATIYLVFNHKYTIVYNIGEGVYISDEVSRVEDVMAVTGETITGYDANANLLLEGRGNLFWTPVYNSDIHFFDEDNHHTFGDSDRRYATEKYVINLYLGSSVAQYTVNLKFYSNIYNFKNDIYSIVTKTLPYGSSILEIELDEDDEMVSGTSPFDELISIETEGAYNSLYDLFAMFVTEGYEYTGTIVVNDNNYMYISKEFNANNYYTVRSYSSATLDAYTNDIYIRYSLISYNLEVRSIVFEDEDDISTPSRGYSVDNLVTTLQARSSSEHDFDNFSVSNKWSYVSCDITRKSDINLIYVQDVAEEECEDNVSYTFFGYRAVTLDEDGNVLSFKDVQYGDNWSSTFTQTPREDGKYGGYDCIYHVLGDVLVYAIFVERPVMVTLTYVAPEGTPSEEFTNLKTSITLNGKEVPESNLSITSTTSLGIVLSFKALYGQTLNIRDAVKETTNYYVIKDFLLNNGISHGSNILSTTLTEEPLSLSVVFETLKVNVYAYTSLDKDIFSYSAYAEIVSVSAFYGIWDKDITISGEDIYLEPNLNPAEGKYYNYVIRVPYNASISSINAVLNNFTIPAWYLHSGTNVTKIDSNITVTGEMFISAEFKADTIDVVFYTSGGQTPLEVGSMTNVSYGDSITLPYIVVDEDTHVSIGWKIGETEYSWGDTIYAVHPENEVLTDGILHVCADMTEKYYLVFKNASGHTFDIPSQYASANNASAITVEEVGIDAEARTYIYYDVANASYETRSVDGYTMLFDTTYEIPSELKFDTSFGGWKVRSGDIIADSYVLDSNDIVEGNIIELETTLSGMVAIKFYITNPVDTSETMPLATTLDGEYTIACIQVFFDVEEDSYINYIAIYDYNSKIIQWNSGHFVQPNVADLLNSYEFYGWSGSRLDVLRNPSAEVETIASNSALLYDWVDGNNGRRVRSTLDGDTRANNLLALIKDEGIYTFYSVWEEKTTVVFDATNSEYKNGKKIEGKYSEGERIDLPSNLVEQDEDIYIDLIWNTNRWIGWESATTTYLFDEYTYIYAPHIDTTFYPKWSAGTQVYFDINFDNVRTYYSQIMSLNTANGSSTEIYNSTGYPYLVADDQSGYKAVNTKPLNALLVDDRYTLFEFVTRYQEGAFWSAGSQVPVYKYSSEAFSHAGIYTKAGKYDQYFELVGWMYNGELITTTDDEGRLIFNIEDSMVGNNSSITLYAVWNPINIEVSFYYDKASAVEEDTGGRYGISTDDGFSYITVQVPFGYKLTNVSDYAQFESIFSTQNIQYMYSGLAEGMSAPENLSVPMSEREFYRFDYWMNADSNSAFFNNEANSSYNANTTSSVITGDIKLYPIFKKVYIVEFISSDGELLSEEISQAVVSGDRILISEKLSSVLDINILKNVFYIGNGGEQISVKGQDSVEFNDSTFTIYNKFYVYIYVEINIEIRAFVPTYSGQNVQATQYGEGRGIYQNVTYVVRELFSMSDSYIRDNYGTEDNYPSFGGWFASTSNNYYTSDDSYRVNITNATTIQLITEKTGSTIAYYIVVNEDAINKLRVNPQGDGLVVNIYAKFYTVTTISLGEYGDRNITDYAEFSYNTLDSNIDDKYYIEINQRSGRNKSISYQTTYNSPYAPAITITPVYGYRISSISGVDSATLTTLTTSTQLNNQIYTPDNGKYSMVISKATTTTDDDYMKLIYIMKVSNVNKTNNLEFVVDIATINYSITYSFDTTETSTLMYQMSSGARWLSFNDTDGEIAFAVDINNTYNGNRPQHIYVNANIVSQFTVNYTVNTVGDRKSITVNNVPYGYSVYITAVASDTLLNHFGNWEVSESGYGDTDELGRYMQTFTPSGLYSDAGYTLDIHLDTIMALNEVKSITYTFKFSDYDMGDAWFNVLESGHSSTLLGLSGSTYTYSWIPTGTINGLPADMPTIKAGDSLDELFAMLQDIYNTMYNAQVYTVDGNFNTIEAVLNYFWFNNVWASEINKSNSCRLEDNVVGVSEDGALYIYTQLEKAVLVNALHQVQDYLDDNTILYGLGLQRIDRADITLNGVTYLDNYQSLHTGSQNQDFFVLTENSNNIIVKMPYGYNITIGVTPDRASNTHVAYKLARWNIIEGDEEVTISALGNTCTLKTGAYSNFVKFAGKLVPEMHFSANVVADTYQLILLNDDDSRIDAIELAYDKDLESRYPQYSYSLSELRDVSVNKLPLFTLDGNNREVSPTNFLSSYDQSAGARSQGYGFYKYLFETWVDSVGNRISSTDDSRLKSFTNNLYQNITIKAQYYENIKITYTLLDENSEEIRFTRYLPNGEFTDQFGNVYYDALLWESVRYSFENENNRYSIEGATRNTLELGTGDYGYYTNATLGGLYICMPSGIAIGASYDIDDFMYVDSVSDIQAYIDNNTYSGDYVVYPSIDVALLVNNRGVQTEYTARSVGGTYLASMLDSGMLKFSNVLGIYRNGTNINTTSIAFTQTAQQQFAYWQVWDFAGSQLKYNLASTPYPRSSTVQYVTYYNAMVNVALSDPDSMGKITEVLDKNNTSYTLTGTKLSHLNITAVSDVSKPSKVYIDSQPIAIDDSEIKYSNIEMVKDGFTLYIQDQTDINNVVTLYTITYTYDASKNNNIPSSEISFVWQVCNENSDIVGELVNDEESLTVLDAWGRLTVYPVIYPREVEITVKPYLYIYNANEDYQRHFGMSVSTTASTNTGVISIPGGARLITDGNLPYEAKSDWTSSLYFRPINSTENSSIYITAKAPFVATYSTYERLANYTTDWRWQYYYNNQWQDIHDGITRINGINGETEVRLACNWKTVDVTLTTMNSGEFNIVGTFNGISVDSATARGSSVITSNVNDSISTLKTFTITMLVGDTIKYDSASETITLESEGAWEGVKEMTFNASIVSGEYSQGWFSLTPNGNSYLVSLASQSIAIANNISKLAFGLWTEKAVSVTATVDKSEYYLDQHSIIHSGYIENGTKVVNGYGNVGITQQDIKGVKPYETQGAYDQGKTGSYLSKTVMGVSSALSFQFADNSKYKHQFLQATYNDKDGQIQTIRINNYRFSTLSGLASNVTFRILYDASQTATQYFITDQDDKGNNTTLNSRFETTIYGGYSISYLESGKDTDAHKISIQIKDMFGTQKHSLTVYMKKEGVDTQNVFYPRHNYRANNLSLYSSQTTYGFSNGYEIISSTTLAGAQNVKEGTTEYLSDSKSIIVFMKEYLYAIDFFLSTSDIDNGSATNVKYLDTSKVTFTTTGSNQNTTTTSEQGRLTAIRLTGLDTSTQFAIGYDRSMGRQSMVLSRYDIGSTTLQNEYLFTRTGKYNLLGLDLYSITNEKIVIADYYNSSKDSNASVTAERWSSTNSPLTAPQYNLVVRVQDYIVTKVGFKLSLPYISDLRELNIKTNLYSLKEDGTVVNINGGVYNVDTSILDTPVSGRVVFNQIAGAGNQDLPETSTSWASKSDGYMLDVTFLTHRGVSVKAEKSNNIYTLKFYNETNPSSHYGYISFTLPAIYDKMGTSGWFVDNTPNYTNIVPTTSLGYKSWAVDTTSLTAVPTDSTVRLDAEASIVLGIKRNKVNIYVDSRASWWLSQNNTTTLTNNLNNRNIDINKYLTYDYMSTNGFASTSGVTSLVTYGGLVTAYPLDYDRTTNLAYQMADSSNANTIQPQLFNTNIRTGVYIQIDDSTLVGRSSTGGTLYRCTSANIAYPAVRIVGDDNTYNVELNNSTTWFIAGIPSGDSNVNDSQYVKVQFINSSNGDTTGTDLGTYSFVSGKITLRQSIATWTESDYNNSRDSQKRLSIYLAKDTNTRLYNGMYISNASAPAGNSYARVGLTFSTTKTPDSGKRIVLTGYKIYSGDTQIGEIKYDAFKNSSGAISGDCILDLSAYRSYKNGIKLCPVWESKGVYKITFQDSKGVVAQSSQSQLLLEGSAFTKTVAFGSSQTLTKSVSESSESTGIYNVLKKNNYIFMGFHTTNNCMYGTSASDSVFSNYGAYRIRQSNGVYSLITNSTVKDGTFTLKLSNIKSDYTFYAVWQQLGYSITYQFNGKTSSSSNKLRDNYLNKAESGCRQTVKYDNYLEGMPYRMHIDYSTANFGSTKYAPTSWSIDKYFTSSSSLVSTSDYSLTFKATSTIYFSLTHNKGHGDSYYTNTKYYTKTHKSDHLCSTTGGTSHGYDTYDVYDCIYCTNTHESTHKYSSCSTSTEYKSTNDTYHKIVKYCACSVCKGKNREISSSTEKHTKTTQNTANCIKGGNMVTTCSKCSYKYVGEKTKALGHQLTVGIASDLDGAAKGLGWYKMGYNASTLMDDLNYRVSDKSWYNCETGKRAWYQSCARCHFDILKSGNDVYDYHFGEDSSIIGSGAAHNYTWSHHKVYSSTKSGGAGTCQKGYYYQDCQCDRRGCNLPQTKVTVSRKCEYSYFVYQLTREEVEYPDEYNCRAKVWKVKFPCQNCANTYMDDGYGYDAAIRLRFNQAMVSWDAYSGSGQAAITDINSIADAKTHKAKKFSDGLFSSHYECTECGQTLVKEGSAYVLKDKRICNYPTVDYILEFQPYLPNHPYVYQDPSIRCGYGAVYRGARGFGTGYSYPTYWDYWTKEEKYGGWWAIVEFDPTKGVKAYRNSGVELGQLASDGKFRYDFAIMYQKISGNSVSLTTNGYIDSKYSYVSSYCPFGMSQTDYRLLISYLSQYLFKGNDSRSSRLKTYKPNASLRIVSSYIYTSY